ncbi:futalosine hydrolase [Salisediminibacterium beveridgei]|uniref:Futalosine hydrolase n=1 Tax=Salisediminibacterium beveridgei TaxID=632773 RepID=A0A1D7QYW8_9BACI|nr:futalosine hydrolase [Salisediminibacterium beveridgei]AOM84192.1 Futalosine Nucleosidase [Salisediminibacterium beveridgei]
MKKILIVTSVEKELEAVRLGLNGDPRFHTALCGVGPVQAAIRTTMELSEESGYDAVLNLGVAGGIPGKAKIGEVVLGSASVQADLGFEQADGSFERIETLGFTVSKRDADVALFRQIDESLSMDHHTGIIVTQSMVTGTKARLDETIQRVPDVFAEGMEGFAVLSAAEAAGLPSIEIRAISNPVGPRKRDEWRLDDALAALTTVAAHLKEMT